MNKAYLLIGGNLGNREKNLTAARFMIDQQCGNISKPSSLSQTAAWGKQDQPFFLNQALEVFTPLNARQLMRRILKTEKMLGRTREEKFGPRLIDIDILLFNDEIHNYPLLKLPHPELANRRFALVPLNEIGGEIIHPVLNKTIAKMLEDCSDPLPVTKFP